jgi:hypothetical protein
MRRQRLGAFQSGQTILPQNPFRGGMGDLIPGCFSVPSNPFYPRGSDQCVPWGQSGMLPMSTGSNVGPGSIPLGTSQLLSSMPSSSIASVPIATGTPVDVTAPTTTIVIATNNESSGPTAATLQTSPSAAPNYPSAYGNAAYLDAGSAAGTQIPRGHKFTTQTILNPLPQIVPNVPGVTYSDNTIMCKGIVGWIGDNPLLAAGALVGLYLLIKGVD